MLAVPTYRLVLRGLFLALLVLGLGAMGPGSPPWGPLQSQAAAKPRVRAFALPHKGTSVQTNGANGLVLGADGAMWGVGRVDVRRGIQVHVGVYEVILRVSPKGRVRQWRIPIRTVPDAELVATRHAIWVAGMGDGKRHGNYVVRVGLSGRVRAFKIPHPHRDDLPPVVAKGFKDGVEYIQGPELRAISPGGHDRLLATNDNFGLVQWTAVGRSGGLWIQGSLFVARVDSDYSVTKYSTRRLCSERNIPEGCQPRRLALGPDGAMWFLLEGYRGGRRTRLGRVGPEGRLTSHTFRWPFPTYAFDLATGPDGRLWIASDLRDVGRFSRGGQSSLRLPRSLWPHGGTSGIARGRGRTMWLLSGTRIVRFDIP